MIDYIILAILATYLLRSNLVGTITLPTHIIAILVIWDALDDKMNIK